MPTCYGYKRISLEENKTNSGLDNQAGLIKKYHAFKFSDMPLVWFEDSVSGSIPFQTRPQGSLLDKALVKGDQVVVAKADRGFRNQLDALTCVRDWNARGIGVHFIDLAVDTTTAVGQLIFGVMSSFAEFERKRIRQRLGEGKAAKYRGKVYHNPPWPYAYSRTQHIFVLQKELRRWASMFITLQANGLNYEQIVYKMVADKIPYPCDRTTGEKRNTVGEKPGMAWWNRATIQNWMKKELLLREYEDIMRLTFPQFHLPETLRGGIDPNLWQVVKATIAAQKPVLTVPDTPILVTPAKKPDGEKKEAV